MFIIIILNTVFSVFLSVWLELIFFKYLTDQQYLVFLAFVVMSGPLAVPTEACATISFPYSKVNFFMFMKIATVLCNQLKNQKENLKITQMKTKKFPQNQLK